MRRGEITLRILECLEFVAEHAINDFTSFMAVAQRPTIGKVLVEISKADRKRMNYHSYFKDLRYLNNVLYGLKQRGLVKGKSGALPILTSEGKQKLAELQGKIYNNYLPPVNKYQVSEDKKIKVIIFDIPEKKAVQRNWFREVLKRLGYKLVQKSVWRGTSKLPQELIIDLKRLKLTNYINIFIVNEVVFLQ